MAIKSATDPDMTTGHTTALGRWLERLKTGCPEAKDAVIEHTCERLRIMARTMLRSSPRVRRFEETDDLLQDALVRLHRSLAEVKPATPKDYYGYSGLQLRRQLIDLARKHYGPHGIGTNFSPNGDVAADTATYIPETLAEWTTFHEQIDELHDKEKEVVHLLWYEGMNQSEAASVLGISLATLKRRWQSARVTLSELMDRPE